MESKEALIERLAHNLSELYYNNDIAQSALVAEQLADALGDPTDECIRRYIHHWIQIREARGDLEGAIRLQDLDITRKKSEIESGDYDIYPQLLIEQIEYLQDSFYLQALRNEKNRKINNSLECLLESFRISERYGVENDSDSMDLYAKLMSTNH